MIKGDPEWTKQFEAFKRHYLSPDSLVAAKVSAMRESSAEELTATIAAIQGTGDRLQEADAFRSAAMAIYYQKLTDSLIKCMQELDRSSNRLARVGWWLTIAVGLAGIVIPLVIGAYVSSK